MSPRPEVREDRACGDTVLADAVDDAPQAGRRDACVCVRLVLLSLVQVYTSNKSRTPIKTYTTMLFIVTRNALRTYTKMAMSHFLKQR